MFVLIARWILNALSLFLVARIIPGVSLTDFTGALVAVVVISLVNVFIKPVLFLLTLPVTLVTLGLFTFVLNALMFMIADAVTPALTIDGFGAALLGSLLYSIISTILLSTVK